MSNKPPPYMPPAPVPVQVFVNTPPPSQALPALCNVFCWPGLGQLIQGRFIAAGLFLLAWMASLALCVVLVGFVTTPIIYLWAVIDAARYRGDQQSPMGVVAALGVGVVVLAIPVAGFSLLASMGMFAASIEPIETMPPLVVESPSPEEQPEESTIESDDEQPPVDVVKSEPTVIDEPIEIDPQAVDEQPKEPTSPPLRTWKDKSGKFQVRASFKSQTTENVTLIKEDGNEIIVPISKLSDVDRWWIGKQH